MSKFVKLSSIAELTVGFVGTMAKHYEDEGIPFLRSLNIKPFKIIGDDMKYVSAEFSNSLSKSILHKGDVVIVRTGIPGTCCVVPAEYDGCNCSDVVIVHPNTELVNPHYLAAYINVWGQRQIANNKVGAIQQHFNVHSAEEMLIFLPDITEQEKIAKMIVALNGKIENNTSVCAKLESMAKTLYDYWFTQFDFPNADGKPYRTSGGEMVWNDQLKREIPKGWDTATINEMTKSYRGVSYDKKDLLPTPENGVLVLRGNNIQNNRLIYDNNVAYVPHSFVANEQRIRAHDIILTMSSGSKEHIGKCTMFQYDSPHTYGAFLTKITPDIDKVCFVYLSMISDFFKKKIKAICNGTGINNLTNETFDNLVFPKPNESVLCRFEEIVAPILEKMGACEKENEELTRLRDWLLPMLMNGQATVSD